MKPDRNRVVAEVEDALRRHAIVLRGLHRRVLRGSLSPAQVAILQFIHERDRTTPSALAQFAGLTPGTMTALLDSLEDGGYVIRTRSTEDRRVVNVALSARSRQFLAQLVDESRQAVATLFKDWSVQDIRRFRTLLDRVSNPSLAVRP